MRLLGNVRPFSFSVIFVALLLLFGSAASLQAGPVLYTGPVLYIYPSIGPNLNSSPSWNLYQSRALSAIESGGGSIGNPATDPAAYQVSHLVSAGQLIVSSFPSWSGSASPAGAFANERGSRVYFGLFIFGNGTQFQLHGVGVTSFLTNDMGSNDPLYNWDNDGAFPSFNAYTVGINYGLNGVKGGGDDIIYTGGSGDGPWLDELVYVGVGNAYDAGYWPSGTNQQRLDAWIAHAYAVGLTVTNQYCLYYGEGHSTCASDYVTVVPEPGTMMLLGAGLGLLALCRWRRR